MANLLHDRDCATGTQRAPARRPLILVAEDNDDTRSMFRLMLEMSGHEVVEATDGEQAVSLAESERPDLILMDGSLPQLDGFDATRRIRRLATVRNVAIVFVCAYADANWLARAEEAGCDEYLVKPIDLDQLRALIERYTGSKAPAFEYSE